MKSELLNVCTELIAAVANGLYQGLYITILVWLGLRAFRRTNAATRHAVWFLTLLLVVSLIPAHWVGSHGHRSAQETTMTAPSDGLQADVASRSVLASPGARPPDPVDFFTPAATDFIPLRPGDNEITVFQGGLPGSDAISNETLATPGTGLEIGPTLLSETGPYGLIPHAQESAASNEKVNWRRFLEPVNLDVATGSTFLRWASVALVVAWLVAACIKVALVIWRLFQLRELKRDAFPPSRPLEALLEELRGALGIRRRVELKVSLTHRSPLLLGFCRPVILVGIDDSQPTDLTEHILRHELAHVRRYDDWANLLQRLVQSLLPFHPSVWWISRQLSLEREIACDDWVLQHARRPRAYAVLLANLAARFQGCPPLLAPGALTNNSQLKQRISMILDTRRNTSPRLAKTRLGFISIAATLLALLAFYAAPRLVLAQTITAPPGPRAVGGSDAAPSISVAGAGTIVAVGPGEPAEPSDIESDDEVSVDTLTPEDVEPGPKAKPASPWEHPGAWSSVWWR